MKLTWIRIIAADGRVTDISFTNYGDAKSTIANINRSANNVTAELVEDEECQKNDQQRMLTYQG